MIIIPKHPHRHRKNHLFSQTQALVKQKFDMRPTVGVFIISCVGFTGYPRGTVPLFTFHVCLLWMNYYSAGFVCKILLRFLLELILQQSSHRGDNSIVQLCFLERPSRYNTHQSTISYSFILILLKNSPLYSNIEFVKL